MIHYEEVFGLNREMKREWNQVEGRNVTIIVTFIECLVQKWKGITCKGM